MTGRKVRPMLWQGGKIGLCYENTKSFGDDFVGLIKKFENGWGNLKMVEEQPGLKQKTQF